MALWISLVFIPCHINFLCSHCSSLESLTYNIKILKLDCFDFLLLVFTSADACEKWLMGKLEVGVIYMRASSSGRATFQDPFSGGSEPNPILNSVFRFTGCVPYIVIVTFPVEVGWKVRMSFSSSSKLHGYIICTDFTLWQPLCMIFPFLLVLRTFVSFAKSTLQILSGGPVSSTGFRIT